MPKKDKRVLFVLHLPPPVHGAGMVGEFIKNSLLVNKKFKCTYLNLSLSSSLNDIGKHGVKKLFDYIGLLKTLFFLLLKNRFNLCYLTPTSHGSGFYKDFIVALLIRAVHRGPIVYHFHNKGVSQMQDRWFDNLLYRIFFHKAQVILLSPELYEDIKKYVLEANVNYCTNGIPENPGILLNSLNKNIDVDFTRPVRFLFLSNMMKSKGVFVLLEACKLLRERNILFECHFAGAWSEFSEASFMSVVRSMELVEDIKVHGPLYGEAKAKLFLRSDIFVFPSFYHNECVPLVIIEAMQASLPVVSTFEGGIPSMVEDGKTGFLVMKEDSEALAEKLLLLVNDRSLRLSMGEAGYQKYKKEFILEVFEKRFTNIISENLR